MKRFISLLSCFFMLLSITIAQKTGVIIGENVNLRLEPSTKAKIVGKIKNDFAIVKVLKKDSKLDVVKVGKDSEMKNYWYQITVGDTLAGFVFGNFIEVFTDANDAQIFITRNNAFRDSIQGKYIEKPADEYSASIETTYTFGKDGKVTIKNEGVEGDHVVDENGNGRFFVQPSTNTLIIRANINGSFAPDGYTWAEYYTMTGGNANNKAELDKYIKEASNYTYYSEKTFELQNLNQKLELKGK